MVCLICLLGLLVASVNYLCFIWVWVCCFEGCCLFVAVVYVDWLLAVLVCSTCEFVCHWACGVVFVWVFGLEQ